MLEKKSMSYTIQNFKAKKALRDAVAKWNEYSENTGSYRLKNGLLYESECPQPVRCFQPGLGPDLSSFTGKVYLEGPHYPQPHRWYAEGWMEGGLLVRVK
jgi:hypothetical protein